MKNKISSKTISISFGVIVILFLTVFYISAWSDPTTSPPDGNVPAPVNVGDSAQVKSGPLQVNGFRNIGSTILDGSVGIGTLNPSTKLEVVGGPIKATGGFILETRNSDVSNPETGQMWLRTDINP